VRQLRRELSQRQQKSVRDLLMAAQARGLGEIWARYLHKHGSAVSPLYLPMSPYISPISAQVVLCTNTGAQDRALQL